MDTGEEGITDSLVSLEEEYHAGGINDVKLVMMMIETDMILMTNFIIRVGY